MRSGRPRRRRRRPRSQSTPQTSGAFCFGTASGLTGALVCGVDANATICRDDIVGSVYVVRWSGANGTVTDGVTGNRAGTVSQVNGTSFEVTIGKLRGLCTVGVANGVPRAQFCAYDD